MIAVIDYGAGNLRSVEKALRFIGGDVEITTDAQTLGRADRAVLPGVGAFGDSMTSLRRSGLIQPILDFIGSGRPFLGVCLGLQMLFEGSEESPGEEGLGIFRGRIKRIPAGEDIKIPHIGWNSLQLLQRDGLFRGLAENPYAYFVHSYYLDASDQGIVSAKTRYGVSIDAAVQYRNIHATQFHPEKSGAVGLQMLRNFLELPPKWEG